MFLFTRRKYFFGYDISQLRILWIFFIGALPMSVYAANSMKLSLENAVALALGPNSGLAEMQSRATAAAAIPSQQGALPDPRFHLNFANLPVDSFDLAQEPMTQTQLGFSQALPFPGKLGLRAAAATLNATAIKYEVSEYRLRLTRDVKLAWWQIFYFDKSLETVEKNRQLLKQIVSTAQTKYSVGQGLQQDVLLAQLELSKLFDSELQLKAMRQTTVARLNALLEQPSFQDIELLTAENKPLPRLLVAETLQHIAQTTRPHLLAAQARISAEQKKLTLAKMGVLPDFSFAANYGFRSGRTDMTSVQLSMSLPIYAASKQNRKKDQRQAETLAAKHALSDGQQKVMAEIQTHLLFYQQSSKQLKLFEQDIIPQAQQTVESMLSAYQVNKVDFLALIRAHTTLYEYQTQRWNAYSRAQQAVARLEAAVGRENIYE